MRVLICGDVVGGVRTFLADLARELVAAGDEVHLALIGPDAAAAELRELPVASCEVRDLRLEWMAEPWDDVARTAEWVDALAAELRPDVIHRNTFAGGWSRNRTGSAVPSVLTIHSDVCTWWRAVHGRDAPERWERYRSLAAAAIGEADVVVTPTAALGDALAEVYGPLPRARVIHNGTSVPATAGDGVREALVVTAGRLWDEAKNAGVLAAVASELDGELELIEDRPHAEVLDRFRRAAVFAEPARYEPFGLAALEAARCGCALVLGDIPSLREVWGDAASYVPPEDPEALTHAVNALLESNERRARAAAATERAARYTAAALGAGYREAYRSVRSGVAA